MKLYQALLPLAAALFITACTGRSNAERVVQQADGALTNVREEAKVSAPAELNTVEGTLAHMKQSLENHDYKIVVDDVPQFNAQMKSLQEAMVSKQTVAAAATQEWSTLNTEVPKSIEAIQARVDSLKPTALPKEVTKEELATAKTDFETMKATWAEATAAASAGNPVEATDKGRVVQAKAEELKNTLGMNETVANAK
jgi:hypothetical protein